VLSHPTGDALVDGVDLAGRPQFVGVHQIDASEDRDSCVTGLNSAPSSFGDLNRGGFSRATSPLVVKQPVAWGMAAAAAQSEQLVSAGVVSIGLKPRNRSIRTLIGVVSPSLMWGIPGASQGCRSQPLCTLIAPGVTARLQEGRAGGVSNRRRPGLVSYRWE